MYCIRYRGIEFRKRTFSQQKPTNMEGDIWGGAITKLDLYKSLQS